MRTQRTEKKHSAVSGFGLLFAALSVVSVLTGAVPAGITAYAAEALEEPCPYKESAFTVTWDRIDHAASYNVKLILTNEEDNKSVSRSCSTTKNHLDLTLFAAGCTVEVSVQAAPSSNTRSKYSTSSWGSLDDVITPAENNAVSGYADVSGNRFILTSEDGARYSGWQKVNNFWFYLDPADGCRTASGWMQIGGADYYFEDSGKMHTGWLEWGKNWYYLNPADSAAGKMVTGWVEVTPGKQFYFTENGSDGHPRGSLDEAVTNAAYPESRPPYTISRDTGGPAGSTSQQTQPAEGWKENVNGTWSYLVNGSAVKSAWKNIGGFWYYFDSYGNMQSGWQRIGGAWYYLEPNKNGSAGYKYGASWMNATTPDGYTVNGSGQWTVNGQVVTGDGSGQTSGKSGSENAGSGNGQGSSGALKQIGTVLVTVGVTEPRGGRCRYAEISGATDCVIVSQTCSGSYSQWIPGTTVTFTAVLEPKSGYTFTTATRFRAGGGEILGADGSALRRTVRIAYKTTAKLDTPEMFYITDSNELKWLPVPYAKRYKVTVTGGDSRDSNTEIVTEPCVELWNYGNIDRLTMSATVTALGPEDSKSTAESDKATVSDLGEYKRTHTLNGTFVYREGILRFMDDSGTYLTGWQLLNGSWFFFKQNGAAAGPGWYQDSTGYWYYFDSRCRMMTGNITADGRSYFLNDGSRGNLPLGAWVQ